MSRLDHEAAGTSSGKSMSTRRLSDIRTAATFRRAPPKVCVARGRLQLCMTEQVVDHRQALPESERLRGEGMKRVSWPAARQKGGEWGRSRSGRAGG